MTRFALFPTIAAVLALCVPVQGGTILSETFDGLTPQLSAMSVGAFSAIGGTNVDILGGAVFGGLCVAPESGICIDLNGSNGNPQGILQTNMPITLSPGVNYFLSFGLIGSQRGTTASATVTFGPYSHTFVLGSADVTDGIVVNQLVTVSSVTVTNLTFTSNTPGNVGELLDNVLITSSPATGVPEPFSVVLIGPALLGLVLLRRRVRP